MKWNNIDEVEIPDFVEFLVYYKDWDTCRVVYFDPRTNRLYDVTTDEPVKSGWPDFWTTIDKPQKV